MRLLRVCQNIIMTLTQQSHHVTPCNMTHKFKGISDSFLFRVPAKMAVLESITDIIAKFEEQLTCPICKDIFTYPKTLPCLHSFCTHCIAQWYESRENQDNSETECPMCKTTIVVPDGDPSKLPSSFYIDSLLHLLHAMKTKANQPELPDCVNCEQPQVFVAFCTQCNGFLCEDCVSLHEKVKQLRDEHQPVLLNQFKEENVNHFIKTQILCKFQKKKKLEYYCQTCVVCIYQKCATLDHENHQKRSLEDAEQDAKKLIEGAMNRVKQRKQDEGVELKQSKENIERIQREIGVAEKNVDDVVKMICDMAIEHGKMIKDELKKALQDLTTANDGEQTAIKASLEELDEFVQHCQVLLERDVPYEEIESKEMILERSQMLSKAHSIFYSQPLDRNVTIRYCVTEQVMQSLQDIGKIVKNVTDPSRSTIESVKKIRPGFINECKIITRDAEGKVCPTRIESIDVRIKDTEGNEAENKVSEEEKGKYRVRFKPHNTGPHEIQVNIGGQAIKNSPQNVDILDVKDLFKFVKAYEGQGSGKEVLNHPWSIAVSDNGEIAIADLGNHNIQVFSLDGNYLRDFGRKGTGEGQLHFPFGLVFVEDRIIVSDGKDGKGRIQEFDLNGAYVRTIYRPEQWFVPRGMCVNDEKNIAVCCNGNKKLGIKSSIKVFSKQGVLVQEFDMPNNNEQPLYITYGNGKYFVSCFHTNFVRVFDVNGVLLFVFGQEGKGEGQFNGVRGLALYGLEMFLVCDGDNNRVQLFTQKGQFIRSFGSCGSNVGMMILPTDVVVTPDGGVLVLAMGGNRVSVWY